MKVTPVALPLVSVSTVFTMASVTIFRFPVALAIGNNDVVV